MQLQRCQPVCATIWFSDGLCLQCNLPAEVSSQQELGDEIPQCKQQITWILHEKGHRLTTRPILQQLRAHNWHWGESTVKRALAEMVRDGELTNRHDVRPRGYGLPGW